jgi:hypothetical protein
VPGEELDNRSGVLLLQRFAGDHDRAGIDVLGSKARFSVGLLDEALELLGVDRGAREIGRQHDF